MVSETARKLVTLLNQPETHRDEVIRTLRCDNVLTAKLLRVCNSAHTGLKHPVGSIDQAVLLLGNSAIYRMVCAVGFGGAMGLATRVTPSSPTAFGHIPLPPASAPNTSPKSNPTASSRPPWPLPPGCCTTSASWP